MITLHVTYPQSNGVYAEVLCQISDTGHHPVVAIVVEDPNTGEWWLDIGDDTDPLLATAWDHAPTTTEILTAYTGTLDR